MPFLMVQNPVRHIPDVELLSVLGLSGSRGQGSKIGLFGTGALHGFALLARIDDPGNPGYSLLERTKLCMGKNVFTFKIDRKHAKTSSGSRVDASTIVMKQQGGATYPLNISVNLGSNDWNDVSLAIREIISNAIDGVDDYGGIPSRDVVIKTDIPDEGRMTRASDGFMRVYVPINDDILSYIDELHKHFRCLAPGYNADRTVFLNVDGGAARIYRKGVLVGSFGERSLFHYNISDIHINESRIVDSWTARDACATAIAKSESASIIGKFLSHRLNPNKSDKYFEDDLYIHNMKSGRLWYDDAAQEERCKQAFTEAVKTTVGHRVVCTSPIAAKIVSSKGMEPVSVDGDIGEILRDHGVKTADDVLNRNEIEGREIVPATDDVRRMNDLVWSVMERYNLTMGKPKPNVECFMQHITESGMSGYYRPGGDTIYIRRDHADGASTYTLQTVIEETSHYLTGASDETRCFQDFAFKLSALMMKEHYLKE